MLTSDLLEKRFDFLPTDNTTEYFYDAFGRRMHKKIEDHNDSSKSFERKYIYDGQEILAELDENDSTLAVYTQSTLRTDDTIAVDIKSTKMASNTGSYFYLKDALGSVKDIVDSSGNLVQHYAYSSFGKILKIVDNSGNDISASPVVEPYFTYTGREFDKESGLYYYRARYYDSSIGRFISVDPVAGKKKIPATVNNKYIYAVNNPMKYTDPSGKFIFTAIAIGASYALGTASVGTIATIGLTALATAGFTGAAFEMAAGYDTQELGKLYSQSGFWKSVGLSFVGGIAGGAALSATGLLTTGMFSNGARLAVNSTSGAFGAGALFGAVNATTQLGVLAATGEDIDPGNAAALIGVSALLGGASFGVGHMIRPNYVTLPTFFIGTGEAAIWQMIPLE